MDSGESAGGAELQDTIAAIATAPGRGGIGVVRISGPGLASWFGPLVGRALAPRVATLANFRSAAGEALDSGIALYFPGPHSFTGQDVLELQAHGGPVVLQSLLQRCVELGARLADPGEFTRRAFLNGKLDLAQAESVADLIDAASEAAAKSAARSLAGEFSRRIDGLVAGLTELRMHVEACIDFPEEAIDPADRALQQLRLAELIAAVQQIRAVATQGNLLREGLTVVLIGRPNVGKSSLLNRLAGEELAIVTPIAGTTRDLVRASLSLEGVPIQLIDTAGLHSSDDPVEQVGMARTWQAISHAGAALIISTAGAGDDLADLALVRQLPPGLPVATVRNKADLVGIAAARHETPTGPDLLVSAKTGDGLDLLRAWLLETAGWQPTGEGVFVARRRHLLALDAALAHLDAAKTNALADELVAEELRLAQDQLGQITGRVSADDLLGEIFSRFCVGK